MQITRCYLWRYSLSIVLRQIFIASSRKVNVVLYIECFRRLKSSNISVRRNIAMWIKCSAQKVVLIVPVIERNKLRDSLVSEKMAGILMGASYLGRRRNKPDRFDGRKFSDS